MSGTNGKSPQQLFPYLLALIACTVLGVLAIKVNGLFLLVGIAMLALIWMKPEVATLYVIALLYTNIPAVASQFYGVPKLIAATFSLLLCVPLGVYVFFRREKLRVDPIMLMIIMLLTVAITSSLFAIDKTIAMDWILTLLVEGLILYFLIVNVVRDLAVLKKAVWAIIFAGSLLGSLVLFQELTHSYKNDFGGMAQRNVEIDPGEADGGLVRERDDVKKAHRAGGPLGKPNRFAQVMLMVFALALFQFWSMPTLKKRLLVAIPLVLILSGVLLTYSRGAFVTLSILFVLLTVMRYIKIYQIIATVVILFTVISIASPGYLVRMGTIGGIQGLFSQSSEMQPDAVTRGRTTEMLAALMAFLDHPLLGVGPGQYSPFYSISYQMDPDIALRSISKARRAHILYFELAAETGAIGFGLFVAIVGLLIYRLMLVRRTWADIEPDLANIATSVMFAIFAYLGTAIFLHLSYQRYLWLILGVAGAVIQIAKAMESKMEPSDEPQSVELEEDLTTRFRKQKLRSVFDKEDATAS